MLIVHPKIYLDATTATTDALLVRDGLVVAVGEDARHGAGQNDETIRPDGVCVMPALADAHVHLWGLGLRAGTVDLRGLNAGQALDALARAEPQAEGWIFAINLDEHNFEDGESIDRRHLDELFATNPVCIHRVDRHAIWTNSVGLRRARFEERYQPGASGRAERDDRRRLTGLLVDGAMEPVLSAIPEPDPAEDRAVFFETAEKLRRQGIAFCTVARSRVDRLPMVRDAAAGGEFPLALDVLVDGTDGDLDSVLQEGPFHDADLDLRIAGIKFFADGALGSAGAHLLEPYRGGGQGIQIHDDGFFLRRIPELMESGWQVAVHAIGDAAVRRILDAYAAVPDRIRRALRPRLEHAQMVAREDHRRFDSLEVIPSIQPIHLRSDAPWAATRLHDRQLARLFPWRSVLPATFAAGSDYPIDDLNPWHGIATALTRRGADGVAFRPDDALTRQQILAAYTTGAAFASHRERHFGTLRPQYRATPIALDTDPFTAPPDEIWHCRARQVFPF